MGFARQSGKVSGTYLVAHGPFGGVQQCSSHALAQLGRREVGRLRKSQHDKESGP